MRYELRGVQLLLLLFERDCVGSLLKCSLTEGNMLQVAAADGAAVAVVVVVTEEVAAGDDDDDEALVAVNGD